MSRERANLYIVRHGQTDWNKEGKWQGHIDIPLNNEGREQAKVLGRKFASTSFTYCYSSDLCRAFETAEIILETKNIAIQTDHRLREKYCVEVADGELEWEPECDLTLRVNAVLQEIAKKHPKELVLVVAHGGVIENILSDLFSVQPSEVKVENAAYLHLSVDQSFYVEELHKIKVEQPV